MRWGSAKAGSVSRKVRYADVLEAEADLSPAGPAQADRIRQKAAAMTPYNAVFMRIFNRNHSCQERRLL